MNVRLAAPQDTATVFQLISELAEYEHLSETVFLQQETLRNWLTGGQIEVLLAEESNEAAGFALYYYTYPTFQGRRGIYLEDLYVRPQYRHRGLGTLLLQKLAERAKENHCYRIDWMVLDWNEKAIAFYKKIGAAPVNDWMSYRLLIH